MTYREHLSSRLNVDGLYCDAYDCWCRHRMGLPPISPPYERMEFLLGDAVAEAVGAAEKQAKARMALVAEVVRDVIHGMDPKEYAYASVAYSAAEELIAEHARRTEELTKKLLED